MLLNINLEPIYRKTYYISGKILNKDNISNETLDDICGNSINLSKILKKFNVDVYNIGFLGGLEGEYIKRQIGEYNIENDYISIIDPSKSMVKIKEKYGESIGVESKSPRISRDEIGNIYKLYDSHLYSSSFICAIDKLSDNLPVEIYRDFIDIAREKGRRFILQANGQYLREAINAQPFLLKVNKNDLEDITNLKIQDESEVIKIGSSLIDRGVRYLIIDLENGESIFLSKDYKYKARFNGRSLRLLEDEGYMLAGYILGFQKKYNLETIIKIGQGFRIAYGLSEDIDLVDMTDVKEKMLNIKINNIN